ncbi:hypothetical protein PPL_09035 [Heterostelium album PN500]|uniref:Glutamine amidotransferase type-2 domain-containing protein n=1 Tax=Heterostelium pallidum (strain ATCC 26659 / Pp 5 / PN500) TaxID=670386 RepID=D3BKF4_HETP5|nr:hypothetical protein PPL_09035 [Heterostelium album PN500]EFA78384.1 hypothetical protein PPL_09035 [Heterostelium album PN500]|eukprot:XP_020430509.1 hypothetical protein PPL_09035 [Heterostelium album PN500]
MCGISFVISGVTVLDPIGSPDSINNNSSSNNGDVIEESTDRVLSDLLNRLVNRGPDSQIMETMTLECGNNITVNINMMASVLGMRGDLTVQPQHDINGNILMWNGELFDGYHIGVHQNDTEFLLHLLNQADSSSSSSSSESDGISNDTFVQLFLKIKGPFAFVYWNKSARKLWFGRDVLGRRSLLVNKSNDRFILASIGSFPSGIDDTKPLPQWNEVNTFGLYSIHFPEDLGEQSFVRLESHPWDNNSLVNNIGFTTLDYDNDNDDDNDQPTTTSTTDASTTTTSTNFSTDSVVQKNETIDQLHFYPFGRRTVMTPLDGSEWQQPVFEGYRDGLFEKLSRSIATRVTGLPDLTHECPDLIRPDFCAEKPVALPGRVGVLFSGGLDSMVLAAVSHQHIPAGEPIHLINVAFGNDNATSDEFDKVPDRKTAISGLYELRTMAPDREWILIKVNVTDQWMDWAKPIVYQLSYPAITIMDMTISLALWFAGRGEGIIHVDEKLQQQQQRVMTTCKVLLMGSGADEQLAGYGRHRSAFARGSWQVLQSELNKDFNRIWKRNLGRDDRVISSNRREPRFPYLDENVIEYLNSVPLSYVCDLSLPQGTGDKRILRELAKSLGLTESTKLIKKAIQFGSRSSKQLNRNVPARVTQKCGVQVFSFSKPLYDPSQDENFEKNQQNKQKMEKAITKKKEKLARDQHNQQHQYPKRNNNINKKNNNN